MPMPCGFLLSLMFAFNRCLSLTLSNQLYFSFRDDRCRGRGRRRRRRRRRRYSKHTRYVSIYLVRLCIKKELAHYVEKFAATCSVQFGLDWFASVLVLGSSKINAVGHWYVYVLQTGKMPRNEQTSGLEEDSTRKTNENSTDLFILNVYTFIDTLSVQKAVSIKGLREKELKRALLALKNGLNETIESFWCAFFIFLLLLHSKENYMPTQHINMVISATMGIL